MGSKKAERAVQETSREGFFVLCIWAREVEFKPGGIFGVHVDVVVLRLRRLSFVPHWREIPPCVQGGGGYAEQALLHVTRQSCTLHYEVLPFSFLALFFFVYFFVLFLGLTLLICFRVRTAYTVCRGAPRAKCTFSVNFPSLTRDPIR